MKQYQNKTCSVCNGEVDPDVATITVDLPGVSLKKRFCSERHRRDYRDNQARDDVDSPRERVVGQLRDAGMDADAFDSE